VLKLLSILFLFLVALPARAETHPSGLREIPGLKFPNSAEEGTEPVAATVMAAPAGAALAGYTELLPYALRSPDQEEAGSCLYMSLTGIAEWWLARLHPEVSRAPEGPIDLSERYLMNVAGLDEASNGVRNWKTDSIYLFNQVGGALRNADYRFTKGWTVRDAAGNLRRAAQGTPGARYDANVNWVDERGGKSGLVPLPRFERHVLFADPASNQWDTGVMPDDIVERIKAALRENKAPVHVVYNHYGYWHATVILGYDDDGDNNDCHFVRHFMDYMGQHGADARAKAAKEKDPAKRDALLRSALKYETALHGTQRAWDRGGGCHPKGVFYVRDSIYGDPQGPKYDYDLSQKGEEQPYVKNTVLLEYDWVRTMANHVTQITLAP
jgi:hypothetical protein